MAFRAFTLPVGTGAAVLVYTAGSGADAMRPLNVYVQNEAGNTANPLYVGDSTVTADATPTGGLNVPSVAANILCIPLLTGESLYVASSAAAQKLRVGLEGANVK